MIGNHSFNFQYISDQNLTISGNLVTPEVGAPGVAVIPLADQQAMAAAFGMPTQQAALGHFGLPSFAPLAAPEPATWACLILGLAVAGALFRIQRFTASRTKVASTLPMAH